MERIPVAERPNLAQAAVEHEFEFVQGSGIPFWDESAYYRFTWQQIEADLTAPAEQIESLCFEVVGRAINDEEVLARLGIPDAFWDYVAASWNNQEKNLIGRMDFSYDGDGPAKLLEYNADTPTALYESSVFQWEWLEQATEIGLVPEGADQFNHLHENLVQAFANADIRGLLHLSCNAEIEDDKGTLDYFAECAEEAELETCFVGMADIGLDPENRFTDLEDRVIETLLKLYPWEWIMGEEFGAHVPACGARFIEPAWKTILSGKGLLPLMWEMFEGHPNLLPAYFEDDPRAAELGDTYVRKPLWSRQGANIEIVRGGAAETPHAGPYGDQGHVVQAFHPLPEMDGGYPLIGCWLVASRAVGMGIREDRTLVTGKEANFVPHVIMD
jgi:glutathionylspermidine synthase